MKRLDPYVIGLLLVGALVETLSSLSGAHRPVPSTWAPSARVNPNAAR
jgi:hypothetical protein